MEELKSFKFEKDIEEPTIRRTSKGFVSSRVWHGCINIATFEKVVGLKESGMLSDDIETPGRDPWYLFRIESMNSDFRWSGKITLIYNGNVFYPVRSKGGKMFIDSWFGTNSVKPYQFTLSDKAHLDFMVKKIFS